MVWQSVVIMSLWLDDSFDDIRWVFLSSRWSNIQSVEILLFDTKYMIQIHYDNVRTNDKRLDHRDHSGIRFYLSDELRQYDLGYLTLGTESNPGAIRFLRTSIILLSMHFVRAKRLKVQKKWWTATFSFSVYNGRNFQTKVLPSVLRFHTPIHKVRWIENAENRTCHSRFFFFQEPAFGRNSFDKTKRLIICSMVNRTIATINFKIICRNRWNFIDFVSPTFLVIHLRLSLLDSIRSGRRICYSMHLQYNE